MAVCASFSSRRSTFPALLFLLQRFRPRFLGGYISPALWLAQVHRSGWCAVRLRCNRRRRQLHSGAIPRRTRICRRLRSCDGDVHSSVLIRQKRARARAQPLPDVPAQASGDVDSVYGYHADVEFSFYYIVRRKKALRLVLRCISMPSRNHPSVYCVRLE